MRLELIIKPLRNYAQTKETVSRYHVGLRGWIYNKFRYSKFNIIHEKKDFKPFCFSNIIGVNNQLIEEDKNYKIIISSPKNEIITFLNNNILINNQINIGEYQFIIKKVRVYKESIKKFDIIRSLTPIQITRRTIKNYESINYLINKKEFERLLKINLIRKYNKEHNDQIDESIDLFNKCLISPLKNKLIKLRINSNNKIFTVMGNILIFRLGNINQKQLKIFQHTYETGFGVKNSYGFGFMIKNKNNIKYYDEFEKLL